VADMSFLFLILPKCVQLIIEKKVKIHQQADLFDKHLFYLYECKTMKYIMVFIHIRHIV